jgi:hypothetical protein
MTCNQDANLSIFASTTLSSICVCWLTYVRTFSIISWLLLITTVISSQLINVLAWTKIPLEDMSTNLEDHEVNTDRNWIEVNSKLHSNFYSFKKWNNLPMNQHTLTSYRYAQLTNLQDLIVEVNERIVSNEFGLLQDVKREDGQTELTNVEANRGHHIPTTFNGKIHSIAVNKLENCAFIRSPEVSKNNLSLTGNLRMQTPNKN